MEVLDILQNKKDNLLKSLVIDMATEIVMLAKNMPKQDAKKEVVTNLENGKAYEKFTSFVTRQGGSINNLKLKKGVNILSEKEGYLREINALEIGKLSCKLGSGRVKKEDNIARKLKNISRDIEKLKQMGENAKKLSKPYATADISRILISELEKDDDFSNSLSVATLIKYKTRYLFIKKCNISKHSSISLFVIFSLYLNILGKINNLSL